MGQKTNARGFRLGYLYPWNSQWFEDKSYALRLHQDIGMTAFIREELKTAGISRIWIKRAINKVEFSIYTPRPGPVIGKKGTGIETLRKKLLDKRWGERRLKRRGRNTVPTPAHEGQQSAPKRKDRHGVPDDKGGPVEVFVNIHEVRKAETDAQLVAENVAMQLVRRVAFRRAMKKAVQTALKFGAKGIRIACSGRLGGGEMSRYEWYREGRVPLHTLRADIDYGFFEAHTTYGVIGVKCWIFKGEVLPGGKSA